ncbi:hypothetical protein [Streptomyces sp. NRRL S-87]|uniref:hypothetical protein n=1 Tax=Streptomyces sp. NRRL S-87 TaxID=1463920 RepID=UPI000ACE9EFD|nr:hypothetical protein [Streptomyces sp. NRRL S-87]
MRRLTRTRVPGARRARGRIARTVVAAVLTASAVAGTAGWVSGAARGHDGYFAPGTDSLRAFAAIADGAAR